MDHELDQMIEATAHIYTALELMRVQVQRLETRDRKRLEKARNRLNAPTTLAQSNSDPRQRIAV